jgi:hypothetical protein
MTVGAGGLESRGLMIDKREILEAASSFSLLPNVVEKDYVLGWMPDLTKYTFRRILV